MVPNRTNKTLIFLCDSNKALHSIDYSGLPKKNKERFKTSYTYLLPKHLFFSESFLLSLGVFLFFCFFQTRGWRLLCIEWHDLQALLRFLSSCSHLRGTHALTKAGPPRFCSYLLFLTIPSALDKLAGNKDQMAIHRKIWVASVHKNDQ